MIPVRWVQSDCALFKREVVEPVRISEPDQSQTGQGFSRKRLPGTPFLFCISNIEDVELHRSQCHDKSKPALTECIEYKT